MKIVRWLGAVLFTAAMGVTDTLPAGTIFDRWGQRASGGLGVKGEPRETE